MKRNTSAVLAAIVFAIVFPTIVTWVYFDLLADGQPKIQQTAYGIGKLIQFAFPVCWTVLWLRMPLRAAGLPADEGPCWTAKQSVAFGLLMGIAVVVAMIGIYRMFLADNSELAAEVHERVQGFSINSVSAFAAMALFYALVHSFLEEYYFRWFVFGQLRSLTSTWPAAVISGLAFMAHHVIVLAHYFGLGGVTLLLSGCIALGGIIWAWQYDRAKSLLGPWLSHLVVDAGIFLIGFDIVY